MSSFCYLLFHGLFGGQVGDKNYTDKNPCSIILHEEATDLNIRVPNLSGGHAGGQFPDQQII